MTSFGSRCTDCAATAPRLRTRTVTVTFAPPLARTESGTSFRSIRAGVAFISRTSSALWTTMSTTASAVATLTDRVSTQPLRPRTQLVFASVTTYLPGGTSRA